MIKICKGTTMKVNQSKAERAIRIVAGLALLKSGKKLGIVPLVTGATGYCPAKSKLLGINDVKSCGKCCATKGCGKDTTKDDSSQADSPKEVAKSAEKVDEATPA